MNCPELFSLAISIYIIWNDLYFADEGGCVDEVVEGYIFTFPMATWLRVDAYLRITQMLFSLCAGCCLVLAPGVGMMYFGCLQIFRFFYDFFFFWWMLIGARMYWGHLSERPECEESADLGTFLWRYFFLWAFGVCCVCCCSVLDSAATSTSSRRRQYIDI